MVRFQEAKIAETHPKLLSSQKFLAIVYEHNDQKRESIEVLRHVVKVREKALAESNPDLLFLQQSLAMAYNKIG